MAPWSSPLSICSFPPLIVVVPLAPASDAVQVLVATLAVKTSSPDVLMSPICDELETDAPGPVAPWVLTWSRPELKKVAGPCLTSPDGALALWGLFDASGARVTVGVGPSAGCGDPKRLIWAA